MESTEDIDNISREMIRNLIRHEFIPSDQRDIGRKILFHGGPEKVITQKIAKGKEWIIIKYAEHFVESYNENFNSPPSFPTEGIKYLDVQKEFYATEEEIIEMTDKDRPLYERPSDMVLSLSNYDSEALTVKDVTIKE